MKWYHYVSDQNFEQYEKYMEDILSYRYSLYRGALSVRTPRDAAKTVRDEAKALFHRARKDIAIMKDPIALFSASWLAKAFDMNVLVMVRHPAAFCSSLKVQNWTFDFSNFLEQPLLMEDLLSTFKKEIEEQVTRPQDIISQAALLWNCFHHVISIYRERHPDWLIVRHEDISAEPLARFGSIFNELQLELTPKVEAAILNSSGPHNPVEQQQTRNQLLRNSRMNIRNWKNRLTECEIRRIKKQTLELSRLFYDEDDW